MMVTRNYRWIICVLLFFATTINYFDRQILSLLKPILDVQLHWTNEEFGNVNGAFQGAYAIGLLFFGWLIDRYGTKVGYSLSIGAWSLAAMGHALVTGLGGFFVARICLGLGEGGNFPGAIKTVALWFPRKERALATSLFNSGANIGAVVAPATIPFIALQWGWQAAFVLAGIAGFVWLFFWLPFYNPPDKIQGLTEQELALIRSDGEAEGPALAKIPWLNLLKYRQTWSIMIAKFLTDPIWWFFLIWLPDYFQQSRGLDIKHSWKYLVSIYTIVTVLSVMGGWITGYWTTLGWSLTRARKIGLLTCAVLVVPIYYATQAGDWWAVVLIGLAGAAHQAWSANLYTTISDMFPKNDVASVSGLGGMAGSLGGMFFPIFTGALLDHFQKAQNISGGYAILFTICASAYLVAFALNHVLAPKYDPIGKM